jgi:hypothetical protein
MSSVQAVEKRILKVEGFRIRIRYPSGRKVRSDTMGVEPYRYARRAGDNRSVAQWRVARFEGRYPGYEVDVLDGAGNAVHGKTLLATVRASYVR